MLKLVALWETLGPYHAARLRATRVAVERRGGELTGMAVYGRSDTYDWNPLAGDVGFSRLTLLPERSRGSATALETARAVFRQLDHSDPTAVAVAGWTASYSLAALAWCRMRRRPAVLMSCSNWDDAPRRPAREWVKSSIVSQFDSALVAGSKAQSYVMQLGIPKERIALGYDAVDNEYFTAEARARRLAGRSSELPSRPYFLASNRFIARKNLLSLVEAYAAYRQRAGELAWDLVLLGSGVEEPNIKRFVAERGIAGVHFPGFRQVDELPTYYAFASCFVHPALREQWGLVVNEAMASELPILLSRRCGCTPDLLDEGRNGYGFDPESAEQIADCLWRMASLTPDTRSMMGQRSLEVVSAWSPRRFGEGLLNALDAARSCRKQEPT